jgi:Pentapeptide repeats (8 copies)
MPTYPRYRCKFCQAELPAWIEVPGEVDGPMLLSHLGRYHPDQVGPYLDQMRGAENIVQVVVPAYEVIEDRRVSASLRRHLLIVLGALGLLAVVVVLWIFSAPIAQWIRSAQSFDAAAFLQEHPLAVAMLGGCLLALVLIWLPKWQASHVPDVKDRATVENAARQTLAQIIGGAVLIAGLFFTWANLKITQETTTKSQETATKNLEMAREGQITDRFTKAIEQLGAVNQAGLPKLEVRLGGIYALARIAGVSEKDHWPIMEVLTAYVRENAPWPPKDGLPQQETPSSEGDPAAAQGQPPPKMAADIQAILTVLGQRNRTYERADQRLDLSGTNLRGAQLTEARLEGAILHKADLDRALLWKADLKGAILVEAHLKGAMLLGANLEGAALWKADLEGAVLWKADLKRANLAEADLKEAVGLTAEQLCTVTTLYQVHLDPPLLAQIQQQCPKLLEKPPWME